MKTENGFIRIAKRKIRQAKLRRKIKKIRSVAGGEMVISIFEPSFSSVMLPWIDGKKKTGTKRSDKCGKCRPFRIFPLQSVYVHGIDKPKKRKALTVPCQMRALSGYRPVSGYYGTLSFQKAAS